MRLPNPLGRSCNKGQSMVEIAVCLPVIVLIFTGILFFGRGFVIGQRAGMAARYAAFKVAKKPDTSDATVQAKVREVFGLDLTVQTEPDTPEFNFAAILNFLSSAGSAKITTASYSYQPNYLVFNPGGINVGHKMTVDGGTWCFDEVHSDNLMGAIMGNLLDELGVFGDILRPLLSWLWT